jgi:hypothetical protein
VGQAFSRQGLGAWRWQKYLLAIPVCIKYTEINRNCHDGALSLVEDCSFHLSCGLPYLFSKDRSAT